MPWGRSLCSLPQTHQKTYLHTVSESHNCAKQANVTLELGLGSSSALVSSLLV